MAEKEYFGEGKKNDPKFAKLTNEELISIKGRITKLENIKNELELRFQHLEGISTPDFYEKSLEEVKDFCTKIHNELEEQKHIWQAFRATFQIQTISLGEVQHWVKVSGCTQQELCDVINTDTSTVSRILNGHKMREGYNDYGLIKAYCLEKLAKDQNISKSKEWDHWPSHGSYKK